MLAALAGCVMLAIASTSFAAAVQASTPSAGPAAPAPEASRAGLVPELRIAHSALLTLDAIPTDDTVALRIRRVRDQSIVNSDGVTISVDGKNESFTRDTAGDYVLPASELGGNVPRRVEMIVAHDGIREVLSGNITLRESGPAGFLGSHKQMAWWLLNIVIVLIAAMALSRRKRPPPD